MTAANDSIAASIIVCTYNRADSLAYTLACLEKQALPEGVAWEIIVVDNNSRDHTPAVVQAAQASLPQLRYEFEGKQGLSHARNHGIRCARGNILLFTDDDVCPEPDWVKTILANVAQYNCEACGGHIAPVWETPPPDWLTERFYGFLAIRTDKHETYQIVDPRDTPFGANMAFRKDVFERTGNFDTSRGRKGAVLASGEDGELFARILSAGMKVMFFPDARVHHRVEAFRVTKHYFRRWRYQTSRNLAESGGMPGERRLLGIPLYLFPQLVRAMWNALKARFTGPKDEAFNREMIVWHFLGTFSGLYKARHTTRSV